EVARVVGERAVEAHRELRRLVVEDDLEAGRALLLGAQAGTERRGDEGVELVPGGGAGPFGLAVGLVPLEPAPDEVDEVLVRHGAVRQGGLGPGLVSGHAADPRDGSGWPPT